MSSIKTTHLDGDVSIGRNVAIGGKAEVAGNVNVGHNLKVDGWLEAPNIKGVNKGVFLTESDLKTAYPKPLDGWHAGVGASTPFAVYIAKDGEWVATGGTMNITIDMNQYDNDINQLQEDVEDLQEWKNKNVWLTQDEYDVLVTSDAVKSDVTYNIYEE